MEGLEGLRIIFEEGNRLPTSLGAMLVLIGLVIGCYGVFKMFNAKKNRWMYIWLWLIGITSSNWVANSDNPLLIRRYKTLKVVPIEVKGAYNIDFEKFSIKSTEGEVITLVTK